MEILKLGSKGENVTELQIRLNLVLLLSLVPDGGFGGMTQAAVMKFQRAAGLKESGIVDDRTWNSIGIKYDSLPKFVVVLDAGHGGIDPTSGEYTTPATDGKRYTHKGAVLHNGGDTFFEGVENRIIAEMAMAQLLKLGIMVIPAHHSFKHYWGTSDAGEELKRRGYWAAPYLKRGFKGFYYSIHSNAAGDPKKQTKAEIDAIRGGIMFTTKGETKSDLVARKMLELWTLEFGSKWVRLLDEKESAKHGGAIGLGSDYEENFGVIRHSENMAKELGCLWWAALLGEFDFFTSEEAAKWIMQPETRGKRTKCIVELAKYVYSLCFNREFA